MRTRLTQAQFHRADTTLVTFVCGDDLRKVELRESIAVDPEMKHTTNVGVPIEEREITLYLEQ